MKESLTQSHPVLWFLLKDPDRLRCIILSENDTYLKGKL